MAIDRRNFILGSAAALAATSLASCSSLEPDIDDSGGSVDTSVKQAPMLQELVDAGTLPDLAERLPRNPLVVEPLAELGQYGGSMRRAQIGNGATGGQYMQFAGLAEFTPTTPGIPAPALAESWDITDGGKVYTFHLREGTRWSDGEPFTSADLMFVYDSVLHNEDLTPAFPNWLIVDGKQAVFSAPDENTLVIEFAGPHSLFLKYLCFIPFGGSLIVPAHYMKQYHEEFADAGRLESEMEETSAATWQDLYGMRNNPNLNPERPGLGPWILGKAINATTSTGHIIRNPYYWKVDTADRQLPYIDKAVFQVLASDAIGLRAANGELDLQLWDLPATSLRLLVENEESKPFTVLKWVPDTNTSILLNQSHPDPVLATLFQSLDFRAGFSHAINRQEINDAMLGGQGTPAHPCAQPGDEYFVEGFGQRFIEFDLDEANRRLDAAGLTERDDKGMRLRPDGKPMRFTMRTFEVGIGLDQITVLEYVKRHLAEVGVDTVIKLISSDLWYSEIPRGEFDIICYPMACYQWDIDPLWYIPVSDLTYWAPRFGRWSYDPENQFSSEPPETFRRLQTMYDELKAAPDDATRLQRGQDILRMHDENVWIIGTMPIPYQPCVVADDLRNIRPDGMASFRAHYEGSSDVSQLFFADLGQHPQ